MKILRHVQDDIFSFGITLLRVGPYCNYNGLYYYSSERVTRAGWELLTIYLRWNPLTRSLAILLMRFSLPGEPYVQQQELYHVMHLYSVEWSRTSNNYFRMRIKGKHTCFQSNIKLRPYTWLHCVVPFVHNVMDMQLMLYAHLLGMLHTSLLKGIGARIRTLAIAFKLFHIRCISKSSQYVRAHVKTRWKRNVTQQNETQINAKYKIGARSRQNPKNRIRRRKRSPNPTAWPIKIMIHRTLLYHA